MCYCVFLNIFAWSISQTFNLYVHLDPIMYKFVSHIGRAQIAVLLLFFGAVFGSNIHFFLLVYIYLERLSFFSPYKFCNLFFVCGWLVNLRCLDDSLA